MAFLFRSLLLALTALLMMAAPAQCKVKPPQRQTAPVQAQAAGGQDMIDISAEESLEWYQDTHLYVARGKAKAVRGVMTVQADMLTAHQREGKTAGSSGDIDRMTAEGNVSLSDDKQQVFGQKAVYDVDQKVIRLTGQNLKYVTPNNVVTAKESLEYYDDKKMAVARGRAMAEHQGSRVEADVLTAQFAANSAGQMEMNQMAAKGNVIIVTKDGGISRGDQAVYDVQRNVAILSNHVRITRGETQLSGDKAEVDFTSGQSRLINNGSGRVRALLPASGMKKDKGTP